MDGALPSSGAEVSFRLRDAIMPELERILEEMTPELRVAGEVVFLSDSGHDQGQFAIVSLGGTMSPLIVPVDRLCRVPSWARQERPILRHETHWH